MGISGNGERQSAICCWFPLLYIIYKQHSFFLSIIIHEKCRKVLKTLSFSRTLCGHLWAKKAPRMGKGHAAHG